MIGQEVLDELTDVQARISNGITHRTESAERETQMDLGLHLDAGSQDL